MKKLAKRSKALTLIPVDTSSPNSHQIRAAKAAAPVIIKTSYSRKIENATHPPAKELNLADLVGFSAKFEDDPPVPEVPVDDFLDVQDDIFAENEGAREADLLRAGQVRLCATYSFNHPSSG